MITDMKKIREFFTKRFGRQPKEDKIYFEEWVYRFKNWSLNRLFNYMDDDTKTVFVEVFSNHKKTTHQYGNSKPSNNEEQAFTNFLKDNFEVVTE